MEENNEVRRDTALDEHVANEWNEVLKIAEELFGLVAEALGIEGARLAKWLAEVHNSLNRYTLANPFDLDTHLATVCDNPKHWHLYKHSKKYRVRKKYWSRFMRKLGKREQTWKRIK